MDITCNIADALRLMKLAIRVAELPDWSKKDAVRQWVGDVFALSKEVAELTKNQKDDEIVQKLEQILSDEALFNAVYEILRILMGMINNDGHIVVDDDGPTWGKFLLGMMADQSSADNEKQ